MRYAVCSAALLLVAVPAFAQAEKQPATEIVSVLVARKDIPLGTLLKDPEKLFKAVRYVKGDEPKNAVTKFDQLQGKRLSRSLHEDDPVKTKDVADHVSMDALLPAGMRAVAIKVPSATAAVGFVMPGSRVDVIKTVRKKPDQASSETVLQNLLVLAVDVSTDREQTHMTVTLAMKVDDAKKLRLAEEAGELSVALSAREDSEIEPLKKKGSVPDVPAAPPVRRPGGQ